MRVAADAARFETLPAVRSIARSCERVVIESAFNLFGITVAEIV